MARHSIHRSAKTERFVPKSTVARWPGKTTTEQVASGTCNKQSVYRSATTGRFVTPGYGKRNPSGTIRKWV